MPNVDDGNTDMMGAENGHSGFHVPSPGEAQILVDAAPYEHDIAEFYSPPRVVAAARAMGRIGDLSLDLVTGWDFRCGALRKLSMRLLTALCIKLVILCPPCTMFSRLQWLWNFKKMKKEHFERRWSEAIVHLNHAMDCAHVQHSEGRTFLYEHPAGATFVE